MAGPASRVSRVVMTGPLAPFAGVYELELRRRRYTPLTVVNQLRQVARLSHWLENIFPDWRDKSSRLIMISGEEPDPRPWPLDPIEQLVWFSSSDAQVWIPTRRQLDQLHADRQRRRNPTPAKKPKSKYPKQIHGETVQRAPWCR